MKGFLRYTVFLVGTVTILLGLLEIGVLTARNTSQCLQATRGQREGAPLHAARAVALESLKSTLGRVFQRSALFRYEPYELWTSVKRDEPKLQTDGAGLRRTPYDRPVADDAASVLVLGGSTLFGHRVSDGETIPAYMQKMLGPAYRVLNMGELGFSSAQELNRMLRFITTIGAPDIVVFYGGFNDTYAGVYSPGIPRHHQHAEEFQDGLFEGNILLAPLKKTQIWFLSRWLQRGTRTWNEEAAKRIREHAPRVVDSWLDHMRVAHAVSGEYGFRTFGFWQPVIFAGGKELTGTEQTILKHEPEALRQAVKAVYDLAAERIEKSGIPNLFDLTDTFRDEKDTIYLDFCHITPKGNRTVAERIVEVLTSSEP